MPASVSSTETAMMFFFIMYYQIPTLFGNDDLLSLIAVA